MQNQRFPRLQGGTMSDFATNEQTFQQAFQPPLQGYGYGGHACMLPKPSTKRKFSDLKDDDDDNQDDDDSTGSNYSDNPFESDESLPPPTKRPQHKKVRTSGKSSKPKHKTNDRPSRLSMKRDALIREYGQDGVTNDVKIKGSVKMINGSLHWWNADDGSWWAADYHNNWRGTLIQLDSQNPPYVAEPDRGPGQFDITSNCNHLDQHQWQFETPDQLCAIKDSDGNAVFELHDKPDRYFSREHKPMIYSGMVMLDIDRTPVMDWPELPLCLSSRLEGCRIEAYKRVYPWIQATDLRARMPAQLIRSGRQKEVYGLSTLRHRSSRFRDEHRLSAWDLRQGTRAKQARWQAQGHAASDHMPTSTRRVHYVQTTSPLNQPHVVSYTTEGIQQFAVTNDTPSPHHEVSMDRIPIGSDRVPAMTQSATAQTGSPTPEAPPVENVDYCFENPVTDIDKLQIQIALHYTALDFQRWHGETVPKTHPDGSYMRQFLDIGQIHWEKWMKVYGGSCPDLFHFTNWPGSFATIPTLGSKNQNKVAGMVGLFGAEYAAQASEANGVDQSPQLGVKAETATPGYDQTSDNFADFQHAENADVGSSETAGEYKTPDAFPASDQLGDIDFGFDKYFVEIS
ncbi:uncharacterized protein KY384_003868 [Bacidia gigantensis]|uniref:uncharacterized protein n=1 Tax=Bacidia gigantensis TaxID=2732470 RepID=UPI001D05A555|nr:uncharacterized protein KY384_003868 [Bacidia gigantensis]KAG8532227.1 hypothetical protein KY384_003868 [Bacidia gigantensis]